MFRLIKHLIGSVRSGVEQSESESEEIKRYEECLRQDQNGSSTRNAPEQENERKAVEPVDPTDCFKRTGTVTLVQPDYFIVDDDYYVPRQLLQACPSAGTVEQNTRLQFLAYRRTDPNSGESSTKVVKILAVIDGSWTTEDMLIDEERRTVETSEEKESVYYKRAERVEPGKVVKKTQNTITVEINTDEPIEVERDKARITFVPEEGDFVTLTCLVQIDDEFIDLKGEVLEVKVIEPSRLIPGRGTVTVVNDAGGEIQAMNDFYFFEMALLKTSGTYCPQIGDTVQFEAVENEFVNKRCISVKLLQQPRQPAPQPKQSQQASPQPNHQPQQPSPKQPQPQQQRHRENGNSNDLYEDKNGIRVIGEFDVTFGNVQEKTVRVVTIRNESDKRHKILKLFLPRTTSQLRLLEPQAHSQTFLLPNETAQYRFEITANLYGRSRETCTWNFGGGFKIARSFNIRTGEDGTDEAATEQKPSQTFSVRESFFQRKLAALNQYRTRGRYIGGVRLVKAPNFVAFKIGTYEVPSDLFELVASGETDDTIQEQLSAPPYRFDEPLTPANYRNLFHTALFLEEIHQRIQFRKYDRERVQFVRQDKYLALEMAGISESRPSVIPGDMVYASATWREDAAVFQGIIHKVLADRVLLMFDNVFHQSYNGESYRVYFEFGRGQQRKLHHALDKVTDTLGMEYLFPDRITPNEPLMNVLLNEREEMVLYDDSAKEANGDGDGKERKLPWYNQRLNLYQKRAIVNVLRGEVRPLPYVIFGPPGSGKTLTSIELILQLVANVPQSRVVVATPSNSAAYLITERLAQSGLLKPGEFVRLVSMSQVEQENIPPALAPYCATVSIGDMNCAESEEILVTESGLRMKLQAKHIGRNRVTISTCSAFGTLMQLRFPPNHFTHVIIDEAGQCLEAETLIPLALINRTVGSVVLLGDPQQLGPVQLSRHTEGRCVRVSLLERLLTTNRLYAVDRDRFPDSYGYDPRFITQLRINYRSIPSILSVYNEMFYGGMLLPNQQENTADDVKLLGILHRTLDVKRETPDYGLFFIGVDGTNKQAPDSPSWFNNAEACTVLLQVQKLFLKGYEIQDIGIITPYLMQIRTIRRLFDTALLDAPKIGTVEDFQGQERRIIIVSTVRSSSSLLQHDIRGMLGFVCNKKRINVAISRAKTALLIVGNPRLLRRDPSWQEIIDRAVNNNTYVGCSLSTARN